MIRSLLRKLGIIHAGRRVARRRATAAAEDARTVAWLRGLRRTQAPAITRIRIQSAVLRQILIAAGARPAPCERCSGDSGDCTCADFCGMTVCMAGLIQADPVPAELRGVKDIWWCDFCRLWNRRHQKHRCPTSEPVPAYAPTLPPLPAPVQLRCPRPSGGWLAPIAWTPMAALPPVEQAEHLQPHWQDATGTFAALAGVTR